MKYTDNEEQIVFLRDGDIAASLNGTTVSGRSISANGVPSFDLVSSLYDSLSTYDKNLCAYIGDQIEVSSQNLCLEIKNLRQETITLSDDICLSAENLSANVELISVGLSTELSDLRVETQSTSAYLNDEVNKLWADVKGGVNYKAHLSAHTAGGAEVPADLSTIFIDYYGDGSSTKELNNGWLYLFTTKTEGGKYTTADGIELEDRDFIIIHNHNKEGEEELSSVKIKDLTKDTIDIIDTIDSDYVRFSLLDQISTLLSSNDVYLSSEHDKLNALEKADADYLSAEIDDVVYVKNGDAEADQLSVIGMALDKFEGEIKSHVLLSDNQLYVVSSDYIEGFGQNLKHILKPVEADDAANKMYVDEELIKLNHSLSSTVNKQFVHLSGDSDIGKTSFAGQLSAGAGIKTTALAASQTVKTGDDEDNLTIYPKKIEQKTTDHNTGISRTFSYSLPEKNGLVALTNDVADLSTALSNDVALSAADLQNQILSNDADIEFLSSDLSALEWQHYNGTLSAIDRKSDIEGCVSADNLIVVDPVPQIGHKHDMFYMTYKYGTLVLKKMN